MECIGHTPFPKLQPQTLIVSSTMCLSKFASPNPNYVLNNVPFQIASQTLVFSWNEDATISIILKGCFQRVHTQHNTQNQLFLHTLLTKLHHFVDKTLFDLVDCKRIHPTNLITTTHWLIVSFFALLFIWFQSPKIRKEKKTHTWGVSNLGLIRDNLTMEAMVPPSISPTNHHHLHL